MLIRSSGSIPGRGVLFLASVLAMTTAPELAPAQIRFAVGPDNATAYPNNLTSFPDEHATFVPYPAIDGFLMFVSSGIKGAGGGAVVLQTQDLQTFTYATGLGYAEQVMNPPLTFTACNPSYDSEFDENYAGPGTVVQDPTLPPGNLIMIYEAENHCPGGVNQFDYYATAGLARSSDNGQTWPAPIAAEFGGPDRYPVLKSATPEPTMPESPQVNLGNAIPSAFIDGDYIYIVYEYVNSPSAPSDALMRVARANLINDNIGGTLQFHKWYNGSFSEPGIGGLDSSPLPSVGCPGIQRQASLTRNDDLGVYMMLFLCNNTRPPGQAAWYYSIATSLDLEDWTPPRQIVGSAGQVLNPCMGISAGGEQFDGWYPSFMSASAPQGHINKTGRAYFLNGCEGSTLRAFMYRNFKITGGFNTHDFSGDGFSDILWRDAAGDIGIWLMNGAQISQSVSLGSITTNWSVVGQRDFNGDGYGDVLWRDTTGDVGMWLMKRGQIAQAAALGAVPLNWSVAGTGDFNGDGKADILWVDQNRNVGIWFMNGTQAVQASIVGQLPANWTIVGSDMNGEIFLRDTATGDLGVWVMSGAQVAEAVDLGPVSLNWTVAGIGDFDGNGSADILWRDNLGNVAVWLMNGTQVASAATIGNVSSSWRIVQTGDYNGDGMSDILWTDTAGDAAVWFMNSATIASTAIYGNVGSNWIVQSLNAD